MRRWALVLFGSSGVACSMLVDLSVLQGPVTEAGPDATTDAAVTDASGEADVLVADAGCAFFDDFNRGDAGVLGNGWVPKQPGFLLENNEVERTLQNGYDYRDLMVVRPTSEGAADVTVSIEVQYRAKVSGYPQIHARVQSTVSQPGTLVDYLFFAAGDATTIVVARNDGTSSYTTLNQTGLMGTSFDTLHWYRFTLKVSGSLPVTLLGTVERHDVTGWTQVGMVVASDTDSLQIASAGTMGFSGGTDVDKQYAYDNFCVRKP